MLTYKDVENLPNGHPLWEQFNRELEELEGKLSFLDFSDLEDEESKAYFDRYIAEKR